MKTTDKPTRHMALPQAKYKARISDLAELNFADHGFIMGRGCHNCLMRTQDPSGSEECLAEVIRHQWPEPFGGLRYCLHPDIKRFVDLAGSVMERFDERGTRRMSRAPAGFLS